jgi:hypothetical protein
MASVVTCKQCGFQVPIELRQGKLISFSPEQGKMMQRCRRSAEPRFACDCSDLISALLTTVESEVRFAQTTLGLKIAARQKLCPANHEEQSEVFELEQRRANDPHGQ